MRLEGMLTHVDLRVGDMVYAGTAEVRGNEIVVHVPYPDAESAAKHFLEFLEEVRGQPRFVKPPEPPGSVL